MFDDTTMSDEFSDDTEDGEEDAGLVDDEETGETEDEE